VPVHRPTLCFSGFFSDGDQAHRPGLFWLLGYQFTPQ
jgi:hypothetical protein